MKPRLFPVDRLLVVGLEIRDVDRVRIAIVDPKTDSYPHTDEFYSCRSLQSFERFWDWRFDEASRQKLQIVAGLLDPDPPSILLWLMQSQCTPVTVDDCDLLPFLREAADYEIPPKYRRAHALAQCAATKQMAKHWISQLHAQLSDLNLHLRDVERALRRLDAARLFS